MTKAVSERQLVELIYAALLGDASWQDFLDGLSSRIPDGKSMLFMHDARSGRGAVDLSSGLNEQSSADYAAHFAATNLWMPPVSVRPVGEGVRDHRLIPRELLYRSEFYNDFLRPNNIGSSAGITIERDGSFAFMLTTLAAGFNPEETDTTARLLERLYPHLKRASNFYRDGAGASLVSDMEKTLLDAAGIGLIIWSGDFRIAAISNSALVATERVNLLKSLSRGRTTFTDEMAARHLEVMLHRLYEGENQARIALPALRVTLVRVEGDAAAHFFRGPSVIALLEQRPPVPDGVLVDELAVQYGLTPAERRALSGVIVGLSVSEIAETASVSRETIRTQLKRLYAKTGVSGQADLLRLAHGPIYRQR